MLTHARVDARTSHVSRENSDIEGSANGADTIKGGITEAVLLEGI